MNNGGYGGSIKEFVNLVSGIGTECVSTALLWSMHCQQVAVLDAYQFVNKSSMLKDIVDNHGFVASVPTSKEGGSKVSNIQSRIATKGDLFSLKRQAPIVSGGT